MDLMPWMQQQGMLPAAGETVLCAVSGGRDSVCLLHYLASLGRRRGFAVAAAHYNHLMRPTAGRDEAFVAGLCRELSVPLYVERGDVRAIARQRGWGVEEAGRRLRYDFLERTADAIGASRIATAHHLSDQAETVVLNLLRGTGPEGLAGIPPVRGRLIRPLLQTPRQEIEAYLTAHGLGHVEDETNDSMDFTRNRLRREVWPLLVMLLSNGKKVKFPGVYRRIKNSPELFFGRMAQNDPMELSGSKTLDIEALNRRLMIWADLVSRKSTIDYGVSMDALKTYFWGIGGGNFPWWKDKI